MTGLLGVLSGHCSGTRYTRWLYDPGNALNTTELFPLKWFTLCSVNFTSILKKLLQNRLLPLPSDLAQVLWPGPGMFPSPDSPGVQLKNKLGCRVGGPTAQLCSSQWKKGW